MGGWSEAEIPLDEFVGRSSYRGEGKRRHWIISRFMTQKSNLARIIPQLHPCALKVGKTGSHQQRPDQDRTTVTASAPFRFI